MKIGEVQNTCNAAHGRQKQKDGKSKARLGYIVTSKLAKSAK